MSRHLCDLIYWWQVGGKKCLCQTLECGGGPFLFFSRLTTVIARFQHFTHHGFPHHPKKIGVFWGGKRESFFKDNYRGTALRPPLTKEEPFLGGMLFPSQKKNFLCEGIRAEKVTCEDRGGYLISSAGFGTQLTWGASGWMEAGTRTDKQRRNIEFVGREIGQEGKNN